MSENTDKEIPSSFNPKETDSKWYHFWESHGFFKADPHSKKPPYCIVIPPPNITGTLHMGHALVNTLQDVLIRYKRMQGFEALWVPGVDHAGIATQTVVEKKLIHTTGKRRKDFSREEFLSHIWKWKEENEKGIIKQIKALGCSCDWSCFRFTMDPLCNHAVRTIFKKMYDQGLIYRGDYLVNWDPVTQTALADDEVEYEEKNASLWHFKYPLADASGHLVIATTRPETMLGDTAVAVSPKDPRYSHLIGKQVTLPLSNRTIPIIADPFVDPQFGTGAVKITPAHDPNDYKIGLAHDLPFLNIMTPDGKINANGGEFEGLSMQEAREAVVAKMQALGLLDAITPHVNRVGISYRSKALIEPYLSKQWFVKMEEFAKKLVEAVSTGKTKFIPKNWENTYFHWINNLRDWCISRQLWWGHRIPIWYNKKDPSIMICHDSEGVPQEVAKDPESWRQDEDVLDTWFSSALWPFSALGWPEDSPYLKKFYPNAVLVTGYDILFFWVARMLLMGEYAMGQVPFPETFLHGLIYSKSYWRNMDDGSIHYISDAERKEYDLGKPVPDNVHSKWEKMSKSKGNIIDPLEVIEEYGTDAIRLSLCVSGPQAREIDLDRRRFEEFRNFTNKIWNGARFTFLNLDGDTLPALTAEEFSEGLDRGILRLEDKWLLSILNRTILDTMQALDTYQFDQATLKAYDFFWKEFCAYYVEISKPILFGKAETPRHRKNKQKMLAIALCASIRLMHPFAPFITEELFQRLKQRLDGVYVSDKQDRYTQETIQALLSPACMTAPFPTAAAADVDEEINKKFKLVEDIVYAVRNIRGEMKLPPHVATDLFLTGTSQETAVVDANRSILTALLKVKDIRIESGQIAHKFGSTAIVGHLKIFVPLPDELKEQEVKRLNKEAEKLEKNLERIKAQLENQEFITKAPAQLVEKQLQLKEKAEREVAEVQAKLESLL